MTTVDQILYLSYDGLTDPLGQSQILPYVIGLSRKGYRFTVISFEKTNCDSHSRDLVDQICKQNNITWIQLSYHKNPPVISTLYDLWVLKKTVGEVMQKTKISIIHCRSYITALVGLAAKRKWEVKFIFDMRGFWADERVEGGLWNLKNPLYYLVYKFFKRKESEFLKEADHVISLTQCAKIEMESWGIKTPISVIPTCVDLDLFDPTKVSSEDTLKLKRELQISEKDFVLLYLGSWGTWYLTQKMLIFFSMLRNRVNAKFLIVSTDQIDLSGYKDRKDVIIRSVKRDDVPLYISAASAAVAFIKPSFSKKASSATKIGELVAMGTFTVTNGGWGDVEQFTHENLHVLKDLSSENMTTAVDKMLQPHKSNKYSSASNVKLSSLSLSGGIQKYQNIYQRIIR